MDETSRAALSSELFGIFARVVHETGTQVTAILRAEGLNPAQLQVLHAVDRHPGLTQADLMRLRGVTAGGVSLLLRKVEAAGLVRSVTDGAANRLSLTRKGRRLVRRLEPAEDQFFVHLFESLSDEELDEVVALARRALTGLPWRQ